jgi:hypothetical protein
MVLTLQAPGDSRQFGAIALSLGFIEDNALRRYVDYMGSSKNGVV